MPTITYYETPRPGSVGRSGFSVIAVSQVLKFVELSGRDRKQAGPLRKLGKGDKVEMRVRHGAGGDQTLFLPPKAAAALEVLLGHLLRGDRVALLAEDQELSPNDAASILGISLDRWSYIAWTSAISHSAMLASTGAPN